MTLGQGQGEVIQYIFRHICFFVPNFYGVAQTVFMWEAKGIAVAAAVDADGATKTNWKHKVTPDRGDLINLVISQK